MSTINYRTLTYNIDGSLLHRETFYDREYIVCPVVAMVGDSVVWSATAEKPEFVPSSILELSTPGWGYRPVVMNHPQIDGSYVSANSPNVLEGNKFGFVFHPQFINGKLMVEAWLDPLEATNIPEALDVIERLQDGEVVEVSNGQYVILRLEEGESDGQPYYAVWEQILPDHLAMLSRGSIGACSVEMGCGANRVMMMAKKNVNSEKSENKNNDKVNVNSNLNVNANVNLNINGTMMRNCALSQARTPVYSGTETTSWTTPNFTTYIKYLHLENGGPVSVSQCTTELKTKIANHSLLGDPSANNLRELALFPVVNPATGKLNEKALRKVLAYVLAEDDIITQSSLNSAQDIATRLLNSEFGLEVNVANIDDSKNSRSDKNDNDDSKNDKSVNNRSLIQRMMARVSQLLKVESAYDSYRELWDRLYEELRKSVPMFLWLEDIQYSSRHVIYSTNPGGYDDRIYTWQRSYTINDDGVVVTLNDDVVEVKPTTSFELVNNESDSSHDGSVDSVGTPTVNPDASLTTNTSQGTLKTHDCKCQKGENAMANGEDNKVAKVDESESESGSTNDAVTTDTTTSSNTNTTTTPTAPTTTQPEMVQVPKEDLEALRSMAARFKAQESAQRESIINKLKTNSSNKYSEAQLKAKSTDDLIILADSLGVLNSATTANDHSINFLGSRITGASIPVDDEDDKVAPSVPKISDLIKNRGARNINTN